MLDDAKIKAVNNYIENFSYKNYPAFLDNYGDFEERQPLILNFSEQQEQILNRPEESEIAKGNILN